MRQILLIRNKLVENENDVKSLLGVHTLFLRLKYDGSFGPLHTILLERGTLWRKQVESTKGLLLVWSERTTVRSNMKEAVDLPVTRINRKRVRNICRKAGTWALSTLVREQPFNFFPVEFLSGFVTFYSVPFPPTGFGSLKLSSVSRFWINIQEQLSLNAFLIFVFYRQFLLMLLYSQYHSKYVENHSLATSLIFKESERVLTPFVACLYIWFLSKNC